ncbi:hypothetical protein [Sorangium sp. So ce542]|uniref:hypothetical protein n=1 Tax=Sorangium sp. So ce542 TaxID=3133316 RepID=UPI003F5E6962
MATSSGKDALARSLDEWRLADVSFEEADSERARAGAMLRQLQAREIVERTYWAEKEVPFSLRVKAVETGLWSAEEAIDGLRRIDFVGRHAFVLHHLRVFPDASLRAVLALVRQPQPGDGAEWFADEAALAAVAVRLARAGQHDAALDAIRGPSLTERERAVLGERVAQAAREAEERGAPPPVEAAESRLGQLLFGPKHADRIRTDRGFESVLEFAEHYAAGDHLALVMEFACSLEGERRARLVRALFQSGGELYDAPGFVELFSPEEQREHLRAELARRERPASVEILHTLGRAARLAAGAPRGVLLSLYLDEVRESGGRVRVRGLFTAASLAEGDQRAALVDEVLAQVEACDNLDEEDRVEAIAAVMSLVPAARAVELAGRVLDAVAEGQIGRTQAGQRLMAIPDPAWAALPASRWEPALRWALENGAEFFDWTSWQQKTLPREVRAFLEAHASPSPAREGEDEASPSAAEPHAWSAGGELSPEQRLRRWASEAVSLSEGERAALAPEIDAAVRAILAQPDTEDGVLCETLASLPDAALRAIWSARARADAWRRTIDISDPALFAYLSSEHYLHADAVLQLILRLGGASALCDFARMLVSLQREPAV